MIFLFRLRRPLRRSELLTRVLTYNEDRPEIKAPQLRTRTAVLESNTRSSLGIQKITRSAKMGSDSIAEQDLAIPVIDFAPMRSGNPEDAAAVGKKVYEAFRDVGFAYIKNHGIPQETVDEAFQWVSRMSLWISTFSISTYREHKY